MQLTITSASASPIIRYSATVVALIAFVDLLGWQLRDIALVRLLPGLPAMSAITAISFLLCTCGLLSFYWSSSRQQMLLRAVAGVVLLIAIANIYEYFLIPNTHAPDLAGRLRSFPAVNRMSPNTAITFCILAASLLMVRKQPADLPGAQQSLQAPFQIAALAVLINAFIGVLGQVIGVSYLYEVSHFLGMAPQTEASFILLSVSVLLVRPNQGFMGVLSSTAIAGRTARNFLSVLLMLPLISWAIYSIAPRLRSGVVYLFVTASILIVASLIARIVTLLHEQVELDRTYADRIARLEREKLSSALESTKRELETTVEQAKDRERQFLRDVLLSVTEGKLHLCLAETDLPTPLTPVAAAISLSASESGIRDIRNRVEELCIACDHPRNRCLDIKLAVSEAAMNVVVHAGEGIGQLYVNEAGTVQVRIRDSGQGIDFDVIPNATLQRGYTTAGTMGHGMKIILQTVDRVFLLTGSDGTTIIMEQDRNMPAPSWFG